MNNLNDTQLRQQAPAIFADAPYEGVSAKYSFVPTITAINWLRDHGWQPVQASSAGVRKEEKQGFQKHMVRFSQPDLFVNGHRLDLLLYNSHDRGCAFQLMAGIYRLVCSNGLVVGETYMHFSHKHIGLEPEKFVESAKFIGSHMNEVAGAIEDWSAIDLTPDEQGVYARAAHQYIYGEEHAPVNSDTLLTPRRYEDRQKTDLWTTFNRVQENALKGGLHGISSTGRRHTTRKVKSLDRDKNLNIALWQLAEEMATIKAA